MEYTFAESDCAELSRLLSTAQRPNVQKFLQQEISRLSALESQQKTNVQGLNLSAQLSRGETKSSATNGVRKTKAAPPTKPTRPPAAVPGAKYVVPSSFGWDQKGDWITIYIRDLPGVGALDKSKVTCDFSKDSFDLCIHDLDGKNYRVVRDNLDKDIVAEESKIRVKASKVLIKLKKVPGQYGSEHWNELTSKKTKAEKSSKSKAKKEDPMGGIMDLMKDMYDTGDEKMKETIGKAMYESRMGKGKNINDPEDPSGGIKMPSFDDDMWRFEF